jgi:hypothetical protein
VKGGWFQNKEIRLENWISENPKFNDWRHRTLEAARRLGIPLHSAQDIETSIQEAGLVEFSTQKIRWEALGTILLGRKLLKFVKLTIRSSIKILVEGESCGSTNIYSLLEDVVKELGEEGCRITI